MEQLHLTELFDMDVLQRLQDSLFAVSGMAVGICDENGVELTKYSSDCKFCYKYTRMSAEGVKRCRNCNKQSGELAMQRFGSIVYTCHAGLTVLAAPITLAGRLIGMILGGQLLTAPLQEEKIRAYAEELGIPPEEYVQASRQIPVASKERIKNISNLLQDMGAMLSNMADRQYRTLQVSGEMEREAHMKSDFLANMSHEIRTPMNAVIGMAEMALRETLPPAAREYIKQIMESGNTLLAIINDILDFSKIESGKMDINMAEYELFSIVRDVTNVMMTRIEDKELEFVVDVAPDIPRQLLGDSIRIRQVIMNLVNNAVKFTQEGCVYLSINYEKKSDREIMLKVFVQDTGIGIKKEDIGKLFQSFQQLDSKRNRNIEGTGLGLAISKQLVTLMNGWIEVESEFGNGSCFSFEIPQFVIDDAPLLEVKKESSRVAGLLCRNAYMIRSIKKQLNQLNVECILLHKPEHFKLLEENKAEFLFIESNCYFDKTQEFLKTHPQITGVLMTGFKDKVDIDLENVIAVRKPLHVLNMAQILAHEDLYAMEDDLEESFEFIAPDAEILIVDDNELNLTVAEGLLAPLQMKIDRAISGRQAVEMIELKHYDLIFMDHMMPELDGIETTHIIRRFHEEYDNVPIIALTANVVEEMRSMFLVEGMNDFVAKPIELNAIVAKLKQWLPARKIKKLEEAPKTGDDNQEDLSSLVEKIGIPELDVGLALQLAKSEKLFWQILKEYVKVIPRKADLLQQRKETQDWKNYTIEVHALKSSSKQIGAIELSLLAEEMEHAGKEDDIEFILAHHDELLEMYRGYKSSLGKYIKDTQEENKLKENYDGNKVWDCLECMQEAVDDLDIDAMDQVIKRLGQMILKGEEAEYFRQMKEAVEEVEVEICEEVMAKWKQLLKATDIIS
ncbi:MAG: response regulator [Lachnospiraceae bacterium]|nr:response regulator [Lachnospiraceae bacterium]